MAKSKMSGKSRTKKKSKRRPNPFSGGNPNVPAMESAIRQMGRKKMTGGMMGGGMMGPGGAIAGTGATETPARPKKRKGKKRRK